MSPTLVLSKIDEELSRLTSSLEARGFKTRPQEQPRIVQRKELASHYSVGSPHPARYTKDSKWEQRRQKLFRVRGRKCEHCLRTRIIQVHHRYYFSSREAWDYDDDALFVLCKICHSLVHGYVGDARRLLREERSRSRARPYDAELEAFEEARIGDDDLFRNASWVEPDPTIFFDEDNPELWRVEYIEDPEGRSDRLRSDVDDDIDDEESAGTDDE